MRIMCELQICVVYYKTQSSQMSGGVRLGSGTASKDYKSVYHCDERIAMMVQEAARGSSK